MSTILSTECEKCAYGTVNEISKAKIKIHCSIKNKEYYYGQYIPCEYFENTVIESEIEEEQNDNFNQNISSVQTENVTNNTSQIKRKRGRPKGSKNKK